MGDDAGLRDGPLRSGATTVMQFGVAPFRHWWSALLSGLLSIAAGIVVLVWPGSGVLAIALIVGIFLVANGLGSLSLAARETKGTRGRGWLFAMGAVDVVAGLVAVTWPGVTVLALALVVGIYFIFHAAMLFALAFTTGSTTGARRGALVAWAIGSLLAGAISVFWPGITILAIALLFGIFLIYRGIMNCYTASVMRHRSRRLEL